MENQTLNATVLLNHVAQFVWTDYLLFIIMLTLSVAIGIYFGFFDKKQSSAKEYLFGGKTMNAFPIAMSLIASHISGVTMLAVPADVYKFGTNYTFQFISVIINCILAAYVFIPVFYNLQITSAYEYLKLRFDAKIRTLASLLFVIYMMLFLPIVIYAPSLALAQVTPLNMHYLNPTICAICIFYTTIGGLKAVVWTDTLQFSVMIGAIGTVLVMGVYAVGGMNVVWERSLDGERLDIDFDLNPTKRDTFWAIVIGWTINWVSHIGISQGTVQKFLSLPTLADVRKTTLIFCIGICIIKLASVYTGIIIYAKYFDCDPFLTKQVQHDDQLLPYYVMDVASQIPGLPGLFIAGIFCAALSTLSAVMNSLSGVIYQDFISKYMPKDITQERVSKILKVIVVITGTVATLLVFVVEHLGGLLPLSISFSGITAGPLLGLFILGMFFPSANAKGALIGCTTAMAFITWIVVGAHWYKAKGLLKYIPKPLSTEGCMTSTNVTSTEKIKDYTIEGDIFVLYRITYYYYALIGTVIVLVVGLPVSWLTNKNDKPVDRKLITPWMRWAIPKIEKEHVLNNYETLDRALEVVHDHSQQKQSSVVD